MKRSLGLALSAAIFFASCGTSHTVMVGSKRSVEQNVVGEIVAQLLENRWEGEVQRRLTLGDTAILQQAMLGNDVTVYPEYTGTILSEVLKDPSPANAAVAFERAKGEMKRRVQFALLDPLGYDNRTVLVIRASDGAGIDTISQAAARKEGWRIGVSSEFELSATGMPLLTSYALPQSAPVRGMSPDQLFPGLMDGSLTLIATTAADGHLGSPEWKMLQDDRVVFPPQQAALLVREDAFDVDPTLRPLLQELSGKLPLETIRQLTAKVVVDERAPADVAREFLQQSGLLK